MIGSAVLRQTFAALGYKPGNIVTICSAVRMSRDPGAWQRLSMSAGRFFAAVLRNLGKERRAND